MVSGNPDYRYFEVNLPEVVALKRVQLENSTIGRAVLARPNYTLLAGDITQLDFTHPFAAEPTMVVSEGIMMYFKRDTQMSIWQNIARFIRANGGEYVFDYIPINGAKPPRSSLGQFLSDLRQRLTHLRPLFVWFQADTG